MSAEYTYWKELLAAEKINGDRTALGTVLKEVLFAERRKLIAWLRAREESTAMEGANEREFLEADSASAAYREVISYLLLQK